MGKKYSAQHKINAVLHYLNSHDGSRLTARRFGVNRSLIRQWVHLYRLHGVEGLMSRRPTIHRTLAFKQEVVQTMLSEGLSLVATSARYGGIAPATILKWRRYYEKGLLTGLDKESSMAKQVYRPDLSKPDSEKTREELIRELQYRRAENAYLKKLDELLRKKAQAQQLKKKRP